MNAGDLPHVVDLLDGFDVWSLNLDEILHASGKRSCHWVAVIQKPVAEIQFYQ